jgi:hypothetical protein
LNEAARIFPIGTARTRPFRLAVGLALSIAVHALLVFAWRLGAVTPQLDQEPVRRAIAVWLRPPPPPPPVAEAVPPPPAPATPKPRRQAPRTAAASPRPAPSTDLIAIPDPSPGKAEPPDVFSVAPADDKAAPRFDLEAAKSTARKVASERDPAKAGTALAQFPDKELATESKAARAIAQAKRRDCKDGLPGGLLGPLLLLLDKKDSGCKW